tara:strand:+ start:6892 stop:7191 length:300 start_codon:yes stop_codon:yes gene_type:complete
LASKELSYQIYVQRDDDGYKRMGVLSQIGGVDERTAATRIRSLLKSRAATCQSDRLNGGHHPTGCECLMNWPVGLGEALEKCDALNDLYGWEEEEGEET